MKQSRYSEGQVLGILRQAEGGAAVQNLSHSASLQSCDKNAPSKPGTTHLVMSKTARTKKQRKRQTVIFGLVFFGADERHNLGAK